MKINYFIDTNVFLDAILKRDNGEAKKCLDFFLEDKNSNAILNEISLINIHYIASRDIGIKRAKEVAKFLKTEFIVVYLNNDILDEALANNEFKDFEDNLQYLCAKYNFCKKIITSNKKDFKNSDIEVFTPKEFLKII